jgi:hypothetical protein
MRPSPARFQCGCEPPEERPSGRRAYAVRDAVRGSVLTCSEACARRIRRDLRQRTRPLVRCCACRESFQPTRSDARTCSSPCRQWSYRQRLGSRPSTRRARTRPLPPKAHQRIVRETANAAPPPVSLDIGAAAVRPISVAQARAVIERYEYLGSMPAAIRFCFGIFFGDHLGGAVVYASEPGENLGIWTAYGYSGKIITLARGACLPWAPPHAGSKLIRRSMRLLPARYTVVTATVDGTAGEIGTLYQAVNFHFVGVLAPGGRVLIRNGDGTTLSGRSARHRFGTESVTILRALGVEAMLVPRRARYFAFRGAAREKKRLRRAIAPLIKPYPKRS